MTLEPDACFRALSARDPRFDGEFFVGVTTTGVYCRPVCPARTPGRTRCEFYESAPQAEAAGFRACFRCRPELAPGRSSVDARSRLVSAALGRIAEGALDSRSVRALAEELGVSARQLRRALSDAVGASPVQLAQSRRLARAKQLLQDTAWPVTRVAFASGFSSVRRFNGLFAERFGRPPTAVRRGAERGEICPVRLGAREPFDWDAMLRFLSARAIPGVEQVEDGRYRRTLHIGDRRGWIEARREPGCVRVDVSEGLVPCLAQVVARARRAFDLDAAPLRIEEGLSSDPALAPFLEARGQRVPGTFEPFELVLRTVLGQQISVGAATRLAGRVAELGEPIETPWSELDRLSPTPAQVRAAGPMGGMPASRASTLLAVADAFEAGLRLGPGQDAAALAPIRGIGPWTVQYVAMRACADPDAFPDTDLGLRRALGVDAKELARRAERWRPWRAYAAMALWMGGPK